MAAANEYTGFSETQRTELRSAVIRARFLLDQVLRDIRVLYRSSASPSSHRIRHFLMRDVETILNNVFDIDVYSKDRSQVRARLYLLREKFQTLRSEITKPFPKILARRTSSADGDAYVGDPSPNKLAPMYFLPGFFSSPRIDQAALIVHELAHQKLQSVHHDHHPGMPAGATGAGSKPHEDKSDLLGGPHFFHKAIINPYCYQWLCLALSPNYNPRTYGGTMVLGGLSISASAP